MDQIPISCRLKISLMLVMIIVPVSATDQPQRSNHVSLGSSLVAGSSNSTSWKSLNGDFAFGFQQVANGSYLLAIVFDKLPNKTIVWSANRNNLVEKGSKAELSASGGLVLSDPSGQRIWAASLTLTGPSLAYGAMLDTGNFVLATNTINSTFLWQSFNEPTDTLLPGQVLVQNSSLFSNLLETDYSRGHFELIMQSDGNLVLYTVNYPMTDVVAAYWASNTYQSDAYQMIFNQSGYLFLTARNGTIGLYIFSQTVSAIQFYQRLTLGFDGVLRHYSYPKSANSTGRWSVENFQPLDNICLRVGGSIGGGICGYNSVCSVGADDQTRPVCSCPSRYSLLNTNKPMGGCAPVFPRQSCHQNSTGSVKDYRLDVSVNTEWRDSAYEYFKSVTEEWCKQSCLADCFCDVAFYREGECWKNAIPLRHGRLDTSRGGKSLVKVQAK